MEVSLSVKTKGKKRLGSKPCVFFVVVLMGGPFGKVVIVFDFQGRL